VDFMSDSISGSFKAGLTIHIFLKQTDSDLRLCWLISLNCFVQTFVSVDQILYNTVKSSSYTLVNVMGMGIPVGFMWV